MRFPIFQMCIQYLPNTEDVGLVFPQESQNILSMIFAIPITPEDYINDEIQSDYYFPSLVDNKQQQQNLKYNKNGNKSDELSLEIFNTEITFKLIHHFQTDFFEHNYSKNFPRYSLLKYVGEYKTFTKQFKGFVPIQLVNNESLKSIFNDYKYSFIGFTPKFGNKEWMDK